MKKLLSFFVLIAVTVISVTASNLSLDSMDAIGNTVPMNGKYREGQSRLLSTPNPFTVTWSDSYVLAVSSKVTAPSVTLSIFKDGELMEEHTFSLAIGEEVSFSLLGYESGEYTVVLTEPLNTYLKGAFVIE